MDYFFAQVEERDNPKLKGLPVAIGGIHNGRGVLSTSNYIAREYGVKSAMPTALALKKCPKLVLVGSNFDKYKKASNIIFDIFKQFTCKVERLSLDEAYLDVTDCKMFDNDAVKIAKEIKRRILSETNLTASAGVSFNKLLAKIGSDLFKPNGIAVLRPENIACNIAHFHVSKIWGVGHVMQDKMEKLGINNFGDLQKFTKLDLINMFGDFGSNLYNFCRGIDDRDVSSSDIRKSLSVENTFSSDIKDTNQLLIKLESCFIELQERLKKHSSRKIKSTNIKIKFSDFTITSVETQGYLNFENLKEMFLLKMSENKRTIRLVGVGVKFHYQRSRGQLELPLLKA